MPGRDDDLGVFEVQEPVFIEALVPESPVERFDEGILVGFAGFDATLLYYASKSMWVRDN